MYLWKFGALYKLLFICQWILGELTKCWEFLVKPKVCPAEHLSCMQLIWLKISFKSQLFLHIPLTYSMVQSPSWEANWFAASQKNPRISRNPKVHYRTHKRPPTLCTLGQPNPVYMPTSYILEIRPNIIHPSTPRSPQWPPSLRFPHQDLKHTPYLTHTRHMHKPSHSSPFYHTLSTGWGLQIIYNLVMQSPPTFSFVIEYYEPIGRVYANFLPNSCRINYQLDVNCYFISYRIFSTCFGH